MENWKPNITFRQMDYSEVLEEHALTLMSKLDKFLATERTPIKVSLVIEFQPVHSHNRVELLVNSPDYSNLITHKEGSDLFNLLDAVVEKMLTEMRRIKDKKISKTRRNNNKE